MQSSVKFITGLLAQREETLNAAEASLAKRFGKPDFVSPILPFSATTYYNREMGDNLTRRFLSFEQLVPPEHRVACKLGTIEIEKRLSSKSGRTVNIDPGFLELSKFILLTTKDYAHRIYLGSGIYAEVTLIHKNGVFTPLEWTYPDYRSREYVEILNHVRDIYKTQVRGTGS